MDCIDSETKAVTAILLTQADKIARLETVFSKHRPKADVFLPDEAFYAEISGPDEIYKMADTLFSWLGIKHRSVHFHLDPNQEKIVSYQRDGSGSSITLGWRCEQDSVLAAAAVAHGIVHHILLARQKIKLATIEETEELIDIGTIQAGFGIIIANSLSRQQPVLGCLAPNNYISEMLDYFSRQRIVDSLWSPYVLPEVLSTQLQNIHPHNHSTFVMKRLKLLQTKRMNKFYLLSALVLFVGVAATLIITRPKVQSKDQLEMRDSIRVLKSQVEQCEDTVRRKTATWNQEDIFIQRQIEADKTRCASLKSRYNFEVARYNETI